MVPFWGYAWVTWEERCVVLGGSNHDPDTRVSRPLASWGRPWKACGLFQRGCSRSISCDQAVGHRPSADGSPGFRCQSRGEARTLRGCRGGACILGVKVW